MARSPTLTAALAEFKLTTCGDSSCMYGPAGGMMTNGGCRCLARSTTPGDLWHASHVARRLAHLAQKLAAQVDQARAEVAALRAALARHKTAAGPAESVHAALGVSSREAAIAAMANGVPCPTCGAESAAAPRVSTRTLYECRTCSTTTGGGTDGSFDDQRWRRIANIDGPDAICPTCIADPAALDDLREEYPRASIVASPPTDASTPCAHLDRAHDGSCFGCGRDANNTNPEATP